MAGAAAAISPGIDPRLVANIYRAMIIPLTKQVQVTYLMRRLGHGDKVPARPEDWPPYLRAFAPGIDVLEKEDLTRRSAGRELPEPMTRPRRRRR